MSRALLCVLLTLLATRPVLAQDGGIPVEEELADMVEQVLAASDISSINISEQTPTSVNINKVNGRHVCSREARADVERLQQAFERHPNIHRNIGPALVSVRGPDGGRRRVSLEVAQANGILAGCPNVYVSVRGPACEFTVATGPFAPSEHGISYHSDEQTVVAIDGRPYSGTDGSVPTRTLRSIKLRLDGREYALAPASFGDLFEPQLDCPEQCVIPCQAQEPRLRTRGGDGAGAYTAEWTVDPTQRTVVRRVWEHPDPEAAKETHSALTESGPPER